MTWTVFAAKIKGRQNPSQASELGPPDVAIATIVRMLHYNAEIIDRGASSCGASAILHELVRSLPGILPLALFGLYYRQKLRHQCGMEPNPCNDFCVHCFCHPSLVSRVSRAQKTWI
ncbi:PLAC8 motif-containing protein - like 10 [Theobroma cacao]|nr:PLAC8 motif-containing protein - like 10 [Theobroma cacao]